LTSGRGSDIVRHALRLSLKEAAPPPNRTNLVTPKAALKRFGSAIFLFYLVKGLVWLGIFAFAAIVATK